MYEVKKGVPRPAGVRPKSDGNVKYNIRDMEVDDCIVVPRSEHDSDPYDAKAHRSRVNQAVRTAKANWNKELKAQVEQSGTGNTFVPVDFTIAPMPDGSGIGIWRDA